MDRVRKPIRRLVALLFTGSAILLMSCGGNKTADAEEDLQDMISSQSEHLTILYSQEGNLSYRFKTPLMERYEFAREPYVEFRRGVEIWTYNDSTGMIESTLVANYALYFEEQKLWEAKGNVITTNAEGQVLETEQLFWNQRTQRIYSNVDSKITQGSDVIVGEGFESDEQFEDFTFRRPKGRVNVDVTQEDGEENNAGGTPSESPATGAGNAGRTIRGLSDVTTGPIQAETSNSRSGASSDNTSEAAPADHQVPVSEPDTTRTQQSGRPRIQEGVPVARPRMD